MSNFENMIVNDYIVPVNEGFIDVITRKPMKDRIRDASHDSDFIALHRHIQKNPDAELESQLAVRTPAHVFDKLSRSLNPKDRIIAAKYGSHESHTRLVDDIHPEVKKQLALSTSKFHEYMASDNASMVRNAVASTSTRHNVLHKLAGDIDPRVASRADSQAEKSLTSKQYADVHARFVKQHPLGYDGKNDL